MIAKLLAHLISPPHPEPEVRKAPLSDPREKARAKRILREVDAEVRAMRGQQ